MTGSLKPIAIAGLAGSARSAAVEGSGPLSPTPTAAIRRDAVLFFAGQITATGCVWLLVLALARLGGPEPVGVFTFALALAAPIVVATQLGLRQVLNTDPRGALRFDDFRRLRLVLSLVAVVAIVAVGFAAGYRGEMLLVIALVGAAKAQDSVGDIYHALLQRSGHLDLAGASLGLRGVLLLLLGGVGFALTHNTLALAGGMAVASAIVLGTFDHAVARAMTSWRRRRTTLRRSWVACRRLLIRAAPLGVSVVLININFNVPRYAIEGAMGSVGLGLYAAMDNIAAIGLLAVQAIGQSLFPRLADLWSAGDRSNFARLSLHYVALGGGIALVGLCAATLAGPWILGTLYGSAFTEAVPAFPFVMAAMIIAYISSALGYIVTATGRFGPLVWQYAAVVAVTGATAHIAVAAWGLAGAAVAVASGHTVGIVSVTALLLRFARAERQAGPRSKHR